METEPAPRLPFNWSFLLAWASATTLGWIVGIITGSFILAGAIVGAAQWLTLRSHLHRADRWIVATAWGWLTGWLVLFLLTQAGILPEGEVGLLGGLVMGITVGAAQAYQMRIWFSNHWWWLPICVLAWTAGLLGFLGEMYIGLVVGLATGIPLELWLRFTLNPPESE